MSLQNNRGRPVGSVSRPPLLSQMDRIVYKPSTVRSKESSIRAFLLYLDDEDISPLSLDPRITINWAVLLVENGHSGQSIRNYVGTILEFFLVNDLLKVIPYGDTLFTIIKRRIRTLSKQDQVLNAVMVSSSKISELTGNMRSLAIFMLTTVFRVSTLMALTPANFYLDNADEESFIIIPPRLKCVPDGATPAIRLYCTCDVDSNVCFTHTVKIPRLPVTRRHITDLCETVKAVPHSFRKTTAMQIRLFNENESTVVKIGMPLINHMFVWSEKSKMFHERYSKGYELVTNHYFFSPGILWNAARQKIDMSYEPIDDSQFIVNEQTIIQNSDSEDEEDFARDGVV